MEELLILHNTYDGNQLWFPFINAVYATPKYVPKQKPKQKPFHMEWSYDDIGNTQFSLPFNRFLSTNQWKRLHNNDYPTFDRTENGSIYALILTNRNDSQIREWCAKNLSLRVYYNQDTLRFESKYDYMHARLTLACKPHPLMAVPNE